MTDPRCDACGLLATCYKRVWATIHRACPAHVGLGWKPIDSPTYAIECTTAELQRALAS